MSGLLEDSHITGIDRQLVALVAKHTTDMRLLVNMRNEYLVFAERLLESEKRAPGLTASGLFALIAYKNFHMNDFEQIARQGSDLDTLYDFRRTFVRTCVAQLERRKRELKTATARPRAMDPFAESAWANVSWSSAGSRSRSRRGPASNLRSEWRPSLVGRTK